MRFPAITLEPSLGRALALAMTMAMSPGLSSPALAVEDTEFRDCETCPVMVMVPAGRFRMGTAVADRMIDPRTGKPATNDSPQHEVRIEAPFAIGKYEVSVEQFAAFVDATNHAALDKCLEFSKADSFMVSEDIDWNDTGFEQAGDQPVLCVSHFDAQNYADWLSKKTGENYRLPSEAEWEYAARAGSTAAYHWGTDPAKACGYANVRSRGAYAISKRQAVADRTGGFLCDDGVKHSAAVGSFAPNDFGVHDMQGNAWEWVADCNHKDYKGAPTDGSAWLDAKPCQFAVIRGGSYLNLVQRSSATVRAGRPKSAGSTNMGFRVARGGPGKSAEMAGTQAGRDTDRDTESAGGRLYTQYCVACHVERSTFAGVYGKDQPSVEITIRGGGNNIMSMPAFEAMLTETDITTLAAYVRELNGWK